MQVKLKVLHGSSAGKEVKIPGPECLIGRHQDCHLRPKTDAISRRHCLILVSEDRVSVRDLNSKNGTFVNEERVEGERILKAGDRLRVARIEFEVLIEEKVRAPEPVKVESVQETAVETRGGVPDDDLIGDWLSEGDAGPLAAKKGEPETRQFRLDETSHKTTDDESGSDEKTVAADLNEEISQGQKQPPRKLPQRPATTAADTREAASEMLRKFFNRR
jgi:pSer/pThr/pTyr-binding forkhead associated (FHA) protein